MTCPRWMRSPRPWTRRGRWRSPRPGRCSRSGGRSCSRARRTGRTSRPAHTRGPRPRPGPRCAASSTPPASSSTPTSAARRSPPAAQEAVARVAAGYSNLEWEDGERGSRHAHVEPLLRELTGAEAGFAVNNGAGAALLAVAALGGREIIVSRGQLVEIGGGFRVPDVIAQAGARLVEVGTTNRTRISDYERAITPDTGAVLRVHRSNFVQRGFVEDVGDRGAVRARRARDRRRRLGRAGPGCTTSRVGAAVRGGRRRARRVLGRQAARRPAGGAHRRPRRRRRGRAAPSPRAGAADRQALARGARGHAAPPSRRAGGDPGPRDAAG